MRASPGYCIRYVAGVGRGWRSPRPALLLNQLFLRQISFIFRVERKSDLLLENSPYVELMDDQFESAKI
jgi:hypothetical protein